MRQNRNSFLYSPELSAGLLGGSRAIFESGYGGNPAMALVGFGEGIQKARQQRINNQFLRGRLGNALRGGATGALVDRVRQDPKFAQALYDVQTGFRQGTRLSPEGRVEAMRGAPQARGDIKYAERAGTNRADLVYKPEIVRRQETIKAEIEPRKQRDISLQKKEVETTEELANMQSKLPELMTTVDELRGLANKATYTQLGIIKDEARKQIGLPADEGAIARAEYVAKVNNQILPLLRDTFGAQFTEREGETLKATLGNPNHSPEEKMATLDAFISQKLKNIEGKRRKLGQTRIQPQQSTTIEFLGFE